MRANSEKIRHSILQSIFENYGVLEVKKVAYEYGVTAQTVYKHINYLKHTRESKNKKRKAQLLHSPSGIDIREYLSA